jgi:exodeoxyribonuclease V gamma subunit
MLHIHHSNRLEVLLTRLRAVISGPVTEPFRPETIVVQNPGMARWLAQQLAAADGIAANLDFPLPASFVWRVFQAWQPALPEVAPFDRDLLAWRIYRLLPARLGSPAFNELKHYLATPPRELKHWQLAGRIADVFDQYLVYRPELVLDWEAGRSSGQGDDWQATLWRDLVTAGDGSPHRARLLADLQAAFDADQPPADPERLPARVALFGLSALPPAYCKVLEFVAAHCEVHLFLLNPCVEYWADLVDERGRTRRRARALANRQPDPGALLEIGHPLLASLGHTGQAFLDQVLELGGEADDTFVAPGADHLLARLQRDMLTLTDRSHADPAKRALVDPDDASLTVHSCHGPLREVQVLHDRLLALFQRASDEGRPLEPRDVLVMAPDIDIYAPFIDAVFGAAPPGRQLPWSIADRRLGAEQPLLAALAELLDLPQSRITSTEVLGWLAVPAIGRRFGIDAAGLDRIRTWVDETAIRWGLDAEMRAELDLPAEPANTWAFGLKRLFLGYALPADTLLYRDIVAYNDVEAADTDLLGGLQELIDHLAHWRRALAKPRTAAGWRAAIETLLDDLFSPEDDDEETMLDRIREAMSTLAEQAALAGLDVDSPLPPELIQAELKQVIDAPAGAQRFLTGRVTFCNMVPMRSIPARVIALLGMNGTDFPRGQRPVGFDLMARQPRRGDRSRRDDDRYLFLEALLSVRDHLHISYIGRDLRENAVKVPSVVVDELLDCIDRGFVLDDNPLVPAPGVAEDASGPDWERRRPSRWIRVEHPLQPFSSRYFDGGDPRLSSHAEDWLGVAATSQADRTPAFIDAELPFDEHPQTVELDDLIRFLRHPPRWFLERRLGLRLPYETTAPAETEPFVLDGLERWDIGQRLLTLADETGVSDDSLAEAVLRGAGLLPHGSAGDLVMERETQRVERFRAGLAPLRDTPIDALELDLPCIIGGAEIRLQGWLDGVTAAGLLDWRLGRLRAKDLLSFWTRHLALNLIAPADIDRQSRFVSEEKGQVTVTRLAPVEDARARLTDLLDLYLQAHHAPLPLYPESSHAWATSGDHQAVLQVWNDRYSGYPGEGSDAAIALITRGLPDPLGPGFRELAERVFAPLLAAIDQP